MVPPVASAVLGPQPFQPQTRDRTPWSCGRQYAWRPAVTQPGNGSGASVSAKIQNLEKTIRRIDEALQIDLNSSDEKLPKNVSGKIQYDKISVFPLKRGVPAKPESRLSPRPFPRSSSFFGDRAKSVAHNVETSPSCLTSSSSFAERACSAPPAPPRLQQFGR